MNIDLVAAKVVLGIAGTDEIVKTVYNSLDEILGGPSDVDSPSLIELAVATDLTLPEAGKLLKASFQELGLTWPSFDEAVSHLIAFWLTRICEKQITPRDGMQIVYWDIFHQVEERKPNKNYVGDGVGLERLLGVYHSYDDVHAASNTEEVASMPPQDAIREIDDRIVELAREWLDQYAGKPLP